MIDDDDTVARLLSRPLRCVPVSPSDRGASYFAPEGRSISRCFFFFIITFTHARAPAVHKYTYYIRSCTIIILHTRSCTIILIYTCRGPPRANLVTYRTLEGGVRGKLGNSVNRRQSLSPPPLHPRPAPGTATSEFESSSRVRCTSHRRFVLKHQTMVLLLVAVCRNIRALYRSHTRRRPTVYLENE